MSFRIEKFDNLVESLNSVGGIGRKSALKYAYAIALANPSLGLNLSYAIAEAVRNLRHCELCGGIAQSQFCPICADTERDSFVACVVEDAKDILVIENSGSFNGVYFVFNGFERIEALRKFALYFELKELVFAFTPSLRAESVMMFIEDKMADLGLAFSKIAQGVPMGVSLDNIDLLSLTKAISERRSL